MSYAVVWSENGGPVYAGRLELAERCVLLAGTAGQARESRRKVFFEELADVWVERRPDVRLDGRPTLVLERGDGGRLRIASRRRTEKPQSESGPSRMPAQAPRETLRRTNGGAAMKRIVIATDGSAGGHQAVETGVELACAAGAIATVVYVRHAPLPIVGDPYYQRALSAEFQRGRAAIDEGVACAAEAGVESESEILEGDPAEQILELARLRDADLIVVGSRDLGAVAGALLGSVSSAIVHGADRPVLVVKQRADAARRVA